MVSVLRLVTCRVSVLRLVTHVALVLSLAFNLGFNINLNRIATRGKSCSWSITLIASIMTTLAPCGQH
jgi:hypothetical protein